jgi:hypothetical protein
MKKQAGLKLVQAVCVLVLMMLSTVVSAQTGVLKAKILGVDGRPQEGVKVFLYTSANVRIPADFISPQSDINGATAVQVPTGKYWSVARVKKDALYGPLMPGDKHSGEPVEIEITENTDSEALFVVADIREIGQKKRTDNPETVRLWGRVVDTDGKPVAGAYVFAHRSREIEFIPEYLSSWTDESGGYTLFIPSGEKVFVGSAKLFPPPATLPALTEFVPNTYKLDVATDIRLIVY